MKEEKVSNGSWRVLADGVTYGDKGGRAETCASVEPVIIA